MAKISDYQQYANVLEHKSAPGRGGVLGGLGRAIGRAGRRTLSQLNNPAYSVMADQGAALAQAQRHARPLPAATPAATTSPVPASLTDYSRQYADSLARSRAGIEQQFRSAFEDIGKREAGAQAAVGLLPGDLNGIYARSGANIAGAQKTLDAGQGGTHLQSFTTAAQQMAPLAAASQSDQATRMADVPLLKLGTTAAFDAQRGGLNQAKLGALGDLDSEQRGYFSDLAKAQEQARIDAANRIDTHAQDLADQKDLKRFDFGLQQAAAGLEARQAKAEEARSLNTFGAQDASAARGQYLRNFSPQVYRQAGSSSAYQREDARVRREQDNENDQNDIAGAIKRLQRRGLYRTAAIFAQRHSVGRIK